MIERAFLELAFHEAVVACDPAAQVHAALAQVAPELLDGRERFGLAFGKAAFAMARGAGPTARGIAVSNADDGQPLPAGWTKMIASHPVPDERSLEAGDAVIDLVASARRNDVVLALVSGGASALVERLAPGVTLDRLHAEIGAVMASAASIRDINRARTALSTIKGGKLAAMSEAPIVTLMISDVFDNDPAVIGSGPTIDGASSPPWRDGDYARVIAPINLFAQTVAATMSRRGQIVDGVIFGSGDVTHVANQPLVGDVAQAADALIARGPFVTCGEPTVRLPASHGEGGRAQQLALELAKRIRGTSRSAFIVGSDGIDGPPPRDRPAPAGAYVDGNTWDRVIATGLDPDRALARCDAGSALHAAGALVVTGPTGINYADLMIID